MSTPTTDFVYLSPFEVVPGRTFANPEHNQTDVASLQHMCSRLAHALNFPDIVTDGTGPKRILVQEEDGRRHRIIVLDRGALLAASELTVVGFCGQRRPDLDLPVLCEMEAADAELINELSNHPLMLSYSSMELTDGNWISLVVMRSPKGIQHWRINRKHVVSARELSPRYYSVVRLHNCVLVGVLSAASLTLLRTKYYDYQSTQPWQAVRENS